MNALKKIGLILVIGVVAFFGWKYRAALSPEILRDWIQGFGVAAPFVYILAYAVNTVTLLPPIFILSLTAGLAFGSVFGFLYLLAGAMLGTTATFFIARHLGRDFIEKKLAGKFKSLDDQLETKGFYTVLFFRVVPLVPYEVLNYASGLSKMPFREYFLATLFGLLPGCIVSAFFGNSLAELKSNPEKFVIAIVAMAVLMAIPTLYVKLSRRKQDGVA